MSTKNLARTVIEGGRYSGNRRERRYSTAVERAEMRNLSSQLRGREEFDDVVYPGRAVVRREFWDKLGPAKRWLASQVGRPWSTVRSELFARFDARTTAGRHILFDHLLQSVNYGAELTSPHVEFGVDRHGILRHDHPRRRFRYHRFERLPEPAAELVAWIDGRRVGERGTGLYWFVVTPSGCFRQHHALSESEARRWRSLPASFRSTFAPVRPSPTTGT